ncbi:choice-of-anchor L domain-containing protein, partial [Myroides indicus]
MTTAEPRADITPAGEVLSVSELISDVLLDADCDVVSNVRYQFGDDNAVDALGSFTQNGSILPFESGIILATHQVSNAAMSRDLSNNDRNKVKKAVGDPDLNAVLEDLNSDRYNAFKHTSVVEFDYVPVVDTLTFEYLFASDIYELSCSYKCREAGGMAAIFITDLTTGEIENVALVPGSQDPVATSTIRNTKGYQWDGFDCQDANPQFFWKNYYYTIDNPFEAPVNYSGLSVGMKTVPYKVEPGRKYHIKIGVMDLCDDPHHGTALFLSSSSFSNLPEIDLGEDRLLAENNGICYGEPYVIDSGVGYIKDYEELTTAIEWYLDGELLPGETKDQLTVTRAGDYTVVLRFIDLNCEVSDSVRIEYYPSISSIVNPPETVGVCRTSLQDVAIVFEDIEADMFRQSGKEIYTTAYFSALEDAVLGENAFVDKLYYNLGKEPQLQTVYIRVEDIQTGCNEVFELHIQPEEGAVPDQPSDVSVCAEYVFPQINDNQYYYTEPGGQGEEYKVGDVLAEPGEHTIYLLQVNSEQGCYEQTAYQVNITAPVRADIFEDKTLSCEYYELKPLSEYNQYFTEPGGNGDKLYPGMQIFERKTVYVYASSGDGICTDQSSFTIDYEDCPIPRGISPNNDGLNDVFDLSPHG